MENIRNFNYNSKVKITDWNRYLEAEPKDDDPYKTAGKNYFLSSYRRWGTSKEAIPISCTHDMLRQGASKESFIKTRRSLVNLVSYQNAEYLPFHEIEYTTGILPLPAEPIVTDYNSIYSTDYTNHLPFCRIKKKFPKD
uniref:Uncharacterized protein n=1 Tax=Clastoptera arizonana TaxID=38151 RepID=A0A1B6CJG0_9HEMI